MITWRLLAFVAWVAAGGVIGWAAGALFTLSHLGLWTGAAAAVFWVTRDAVQARRLLQALRAEDLGRLQLSPGFWCDLADQLHRRFRQQAQQIEEARARLERFLQALQASPNGVILLDAHFAIQWCNATAANHFGLDPVRDHLQKLPNLVRYPGFAQHLLAQGAGGEMVMPGPRSTPSHPVSLAVRLHPYGNGQSLLLSRDVTALEQADAMRRDFVANVSHEIRTPLTVLTGFIETLQALPLQEDDRQRYLDLMAEQARRMQSLVSDLLTLSRLEGSPPPGLDTALSLSRAIEQLAHEGRALSQASAGSAEPVHRLVFVCRGQGELLGNPVELLSAMSNLVSNAVRYTPAGGGIDVEVSARPDGGLLFSVRDEGPGIAAEHLPRLTERFYRVDRSRSRETGGTGLGLAIVKHVAQRHGAELLIESVVGRGSRFALSFPAYRVAWAPSDPQ
ncbi:MAG: phosphate regulon sensor histidine kinase PhoR [Rhodoferax sp.]